MCRRNQIIGCAALAFGIGLLIGIWIEGGFWGHCIGFVLIGAGCSLLRKR